MDGVSVDVGKFELKVFVPVHALAEASILATVLLSTYALVANWVLVVGVSVDVGNNVLNVFKLVHEFGPVKRAVTFVSTYDLVTSWVLDEGVAVDVGRLTNVALPGKDTVSEAVPRTI